MIFPNKTFFTGLIICSIIVDVHVPLFPDFREITIKDKDKITEIIRNYRPTTSEWTFTNLFMWRNRYGFMWSLLEETLLLVSRRENESTYGFQPMGTQLEQATLALFEWLRMKNKHTAPRIERADTRFVNKIKDLRGVIITPTREHFDYVYLREDLVQLKGKRYRSQRNHISKALRSNLFEFQVLKREHMDGCIEVHKRWCEIKGCNEDEGLNAEFLAVNEMFQYYDELDLIGGVVLLGKRVVAFSVGEMLNDDTMVIHVEKVDPEYPVLYAFINQKFCEVCAEDAIYINREQDLGIPGLRVAKMSYHPHHLEEKYRVEGS